MSERLTDEGESLDSRAVAKKIAELEAEVAKLKAERDETVAQGRLTIEGLHQEVAKLKAQVKRWEDHEVRKASCCSDMEEDNARLRDLLRWRKTSEEAPTESGNVLMENHRNELAVVWVCNPKLWAGKNAGLNWPYWRPLGPLPGEPKGGE